MKLHLPNTLRKALMAVLAGTTYYSTAEAGCMHAGVSPTIYTDFGQNMGRYSVYQVNELLSTITRENGILIPYTTGAEPGKLEHKMISFEGMNNDGAFTAVGYNYTATVAHNGCPNPSFTPRYIGDNQAIHYQGVEYRSSENKAFLLQPGIDYKVTRSSKIFTDITASGVFDVTEYLRSGHQVTELVHYRAGAGSQEVADFEGHTHGVAGGYAYITGGVVATLGFNYANSYNYETGEGPVDGRGIIDDPYTISVHGIQDYGPGGAGQPTPDNPRVYLLPFVSRGGDSGSPVWAWDAVDEEYKLISCHQARGGDNSYSRGASQWTIETMESFNKDVNMDAAGHTVHLHGAVYNAELSKHISDSTNHVETTTQYGYITGENDFETVYFCGVGSDLETQETVYTWLSLADQKNVQNWFSYGNTYFNANGNGAGKQMHLGDLFNTENIVFSASGGNDNYIHLDGDVDTGIGYVQFSPGEGATEGQNVKFYLLSDGSVADGKDGAARNYMLNSAGYIVDKGAELHIQVSNTQWDAAHSDYYYREWRKQGAGDMYIEGTGNNEVFLNLGGKGTTYLKETNGYAAYNVLINNGATVNFGGDIKQIARDVTFGNGGGFLEFSGLSSFDWYSGENQDVAADGFTINALTQDATLINSTGSTTLHYKTGGNTTFLGSFQDTENSSLNVIYEGGGTWTLNSIHTKLLNAGSKFTVASGTAELVGTNTVHALGSIEGKAGTRYFHPDDWHYADSTMNVEVQNGATFRLGSHARLTGNVNVLDGGTLEIAEGVKHRYEYIEGWLIAEDTYQQFYRDFYGLKGDVTLGNGSTLRFNFSSGTDAENVYGGNISGTGNVDMRLGGSGATLVLSGTNDFTGTKHLAGGGLIAEAYTALGNTADNKWHVAEDAFIAVKDIDGNAALTYIDGDSTGVLALTQDQTEQVNLIGTGHTGMIVGALAGETIQYGTEPVTSGRHTDYTTEKLTPVELEGQKQWRLGGGGGELVVNFLLEDAAAELVLGNEYTTGTVTLTNIWNQIGSIKFAGQVTLNYTSEEALGGSKISLGYTNRVVGSSALLSQITRSSDGVLLLDKMPAAAVDLTDHHFMALGSDGDMVYSGNITPTAGGYRFGGITGTLELQTALTDGEGESRGLMVDAQGYTGGTLALASQATLTGDVVVTGHDTDRHPEFSGGDIALRLDVNDAMADARSITLKEGGSIDINGTTQTFRGFNTESGSMLVDTSEAWNGSATIEVAADGTSRLLGGVEVANLVKTGAGTLELGGSNVYNTLLIHEGSVLLKDKNSLSASGIAMIESGGVLDATEADVTGAIGFAGGKLVVGNKQLGGSLAVAQGYDGRVEQSAVGMTTNVNSTVDVAPGGKLTLAGENGTFRFSALDINEAGGTIELDAHYLTINKGGQDPVNVGGTISLKGYTQGSDRATLYSDGSSDNMTRNINELHIAGGNAAIQEASWNTIWNIHSLTGSGDLKWVSNTTHWYSARVVLDGANSFSGQFTAERTYGNVSNRCYQSFVEARHDLAMQNMDVSVIGKGNQSNMALAVNTDDLHMRSLSGNEHALLYAGASVEVADHDKDEPLKAAPESTRRATLTITGTGHTFSGNVSGQDRYIGYETKEDGSQVQVADVTNAGISIVMDGRGMQTFNGAHTRFNSVTVNSGVLELASADLTIKEDVTITRGAELRLSQAYALDSGKTLTVLANDPGTTAMLSGGLTLNGGTLTFSAEGLSNSAPALSIGSLSGSSVTLNFTETHAFTSGVRYHLADQDWSDIDISDATEGLTYLTASYEKDVNGLFVSFDTKKGNLIWGGTNDHHDWNSTTFGPSGLVPTSDQTAVFNDAAPYHHVNITDDVKVTGLVFDAAGDYDLTSNNASKLTTGSVVQSGTGTTVLTDAVQVGTDQSRGTVTVTNGELRVTNEAVLQNVDTITGGGTLGVDFGAGNRGTVDALFVPGSSVGSLHVVSGTFEAYGTPGYASLLLDAGAGYTVSAEQTLAYMQVGQGEGGSPAALNLGKRTLTAAMVVMQGDLAISGNGGELHADITGGHTITTSGTVTLRGSNFDGNLHVQSGMLKLFDGANSHVAGITMDADTTLYLGISTGLEGGATIHMGNNASLQMENGAGGSHIVNANIVLDGSSASLCGTLNGNSTVVRGSIAGHGTLFLKAQSSFWNNSWSIESLLQDGEGGALALSSDGNVTLSGANTYSGGTTITGNKLTTNNERALGTGTLNMTAGELVLKKDLTVGGLSGSETASINLGSKRLTVDSDGNTRFSGEISNGSLAKLGSGTLEIEVGGELDNISVGCGTLDLGDCALTGNLSVAAGTTLDFTGDMLRLSHAVDNAGTFRFRTSGTSIEIENGSGFDIHTDGYLDVNGNKAENGFAQGLTIQVFENTGDGQIEGITPEVAYMGDTLTLDLATGVASRGASTSAYSVRTGTVVYDDAFAAKEAAQTIEFFSLEGHSMEETATLRLSRNLADGVGIRVSNYGGNIELDQGVVLSADRLEMQSYATLTGSGTYALHAGTAAMTDLVLLDGERWTGAVRLSDMSFSDTDITALANTASYVEMYGITGGYLKQWKTSLNTNIRLTDTESGAYAWKWTDGQSSGASTITFNGKWDGSGTFAMGGSGKSQNFTFKGDLSGWNGRYIQVDNNSDVTFARPGEQQVNADFERQKGTLNIIVGNGSTSTNAAFNGNLVNVSSLLVKSASTATLAGERNTLGALTVENGAELTNIGSTVLTGSLTNSGTISNSGSLDLGDSAASVGNITNAGTLTIGTTLTGGTIDNTGDIIISSLMAGQRSGWVDALGRSGTENPHNNGFAATTLTVLDSGATINNSGDGRILYGGVDVTQQVLDTGSVTNQENHGTYYIRYTDDSVAYSNIARASQGALEFVQFYSDSAANLKVDSAEDLPSLRTSQVMINKLQVGDVTLNLQNGATLVVDASTKAKVNASNGSTITLDLAAATPETRMTLGGFTPNGAEVNVTGSGVLDLGGDTYNISTLNIHGGTVRTSHSGNGGFTQRHTVNINAGGILQLDNVDALGYGGGATSTINLHGATTDYAVLELGGRQTYQSTVINMQGNAEIRAMANTRAAHQRPMIDPYGSQQTINASGTNNLIAVPLRFRHDLKVQVESGGELTLAGGVYYDNESSTPRTITKTGAGKLVFDEPRVDYGQHNYTGTFALSEGSAEIKADAAFNNVTASAALAITRGSTTITTYTGNDGSSVSVGHGATLVINGISTLASAISNSGAVTFGSGCTELTLSGEFENEGEVYRDLASGTISAEGNGLKSGGYVTVLNGDGSVRLNGDVSVKYDNKTYTLQTDGKAYLGSDSHTYYVRKDTAVYNSAVAAEASITTIELSNGAIMDMQVNLAADVGITSSGGTIRIGEGVVLSRDSLTASAATTLAGSGTYTLDLEKEATRGSHVNYAQDWNGTVRLSRTAREMVDLNSIAQRGANEYVALELAGATMELKAGDIHSDLQLEDIDEWSPALMITNSGNFVFHGDISGSGTIMSWTDSASNYTFSGGDLSKWNGVLETYDSPLNVAFVNMKNGGVMGGSLDMADSISYTGTAAGDIYTVAAVVANPNVTALSGSNATLKIANLSGIGALTVSGSVELAGGEYGGESISLSNASATLALSGVDASQAALNLNGGNVVLKAAVASLAGLNGSGSIDAGDAQPHTLVLCGSANYSSSASIGADIDLEMDGSGSQTLTGDFSRFNGGIYTTDGTLNLQQNNESTTIMLLDMEGGTVNFGGSNATALEAVRIVSGATAAVSVANGASVKLGRSIQNSGALTLSGRLDVSELALSRVDRGFIDTADTPTMDGSGFATSSSAVRVVRNISDGSLTVQHAVADYNGETVDINQDGIAVLNIGYAVAADTYYVRDDSQHVNSFSAIADKAQEYEGTLEHVVFDKADAHLQLDAVADMGVFTVENSSAAHVEVTQAGQLNMGALSAGVDGSMLLNGAGKVQLSGRAGLARNVQLATDWQGTVTLTGNSNGVNLGADGGLWTGSGSSATTIEFNNWNGTLVPPASEADVTQIGAKVVMNGMTLTESATGANLAFNNTITGNGDLMNNSGSELYLELYGDISGWDGALVTENGSTTVTLLGGQAEVNNDILMGANGSVTVTAVSDTTFNGQVQADMLVIGAGLATIASDFEVQDISCYGSLAVGQGGNLSVSGNVSGLNAPVANAGSVSFVGDEVHTITLDGQAQFAFSEVHYTDKDGHETTNGNGFRSGGTATLIEMAQGAHLSGAENVIVSYKNQLYTLLDDGTFGDRYGEGTYYIHEGTVNYSEIKALDGLVGLHLDSTLVPDATATLNLDENLADTVTNGIVSDGGTVSIAQDVTLQRTQLRAQAATKLAGQGVYDLGGGVSSLGDNITLDGTNWSGTVRLSDVARLDKINLQSYAGSNDSTVALRGVSGWIYAQQTNLNAHLMLEKDPADASNPALMLIDASSDKEYKLNGGVCGDGDYVLGFDSSKRISGTTHTFCGNVENWTGSFIDAVAQTGQANTTTLKFTENTAVNGVVNIGAGVIDRSSGADHKLNVYVDENAARINMNGALAGIDKLTYKANNTGRSLHIADLTTNSSGTTLEFADGGHTSTIEVNNLHGNGTLTLNNNCKATGLANFVLNGGDYSGETIEFNAMKANYSDSPRCVLLTIGDEHVAENSVIHTTINKTGNQTVNIGIAVNADTVRVGGLNDTITSMAATCVYSLVSGNPTSHTGANATGFESDGSIRTLEIVGNGGSTHANVGANLNITMDSAGHTQAFTGDMAAFSGAIDVQAGTLDITSTGAVSLHAVNVEEGASLVLAATNATTMAQTIINHGSLTIGGAFVLDAMDISDASKFEDGEASEHNGFLVGGPSIQVVSGNSATLAQGGVTMTYKGEQGSFDAATGRASFAGTGQTQYETFYVNSADTAESLAHAKAASGGALDTVRLTDGTTLNMDLADGTLNTVQVSSGASATLHVSKNVTLSSVTGLENGQTLAVTGAEGGRLTMAVGTDTAIGGTIEVRDGGYVVLGNFQAFGSHSNKVVIGRGGIVDVNGKSDAKYVYTLDGGFLTNTGSSLADNWAQTSGLVLTDDSSIGGNNCDFRILSGNFAANSVKLDGHILTKVGSNMIGFVNTTFNEGTLRVEQGKLDFDSGNRKNNDVLNGTRIVLADAQAGAADKMIGSVHVEGSAEINAEQSSQASVQINIRDNAALSVGAEQDRNLKLTGTVTGGDSTTIRKTDEGSVELSGSTAGFHGSVDVESGVLNILNAASVDVKDVTIGANSTLGVYNGTTATADTEHEGTLTIKNAQSLTAQGVGATLNANLLMEAGSTIDVSSTGGIGLTLGSALTLNMDMDLSEADYANVAKLQVGETYVLFNGVDALKLGETSYTEIDPVQVDAADYYKGLESGSYYLVYNYDGSNVGQVAIFSTVPEPATSTLSLLALAALAARRRRK